MSAHLRSSQAQEFTAAIGHLAPVPPCNEKGHNILVEFNCFTYLEAIVNITILNQYFDITGNTFNRFLVES